jgi:nucleoid-associated protein YgaU
MSTNRYNNRRIKYNQSELIQKILDIKNIDGIRHYVSPTLKIPTYLDRINIKTVGLVWKRGDRLSKYAERYYLDPQLWWVIAMYNNKPTDAHFTIGDVFYIPTDLNNLFQYAEV